jgi:hypothetical protein
MSSWGLQGSLTVFGVAVLFNNTIIALLWPFLAARCSGVLPLLFCIFGFIFVSFNKL